MEELWRNNNRGEGHKVFFSGKGHKHEHGVGLLVHIGIVNTVIGCRPVSSRLITNRLKAVPLNLTVVQVYAQTSNYDENEIEIFYDQLQNVIDQTPKKDILVQRDWNAEVARMLVKTGMVFVDPSAMTTQMREDSNFWSLPP